MTQRHTVRVPARDALIQCVGAGGGGGGGAVKRLAPAPRPRMFTAIIRPADKFSPTFIL